ncbi:MAG: 1-acyl-sn-glycerol-3-phosphate acyltransferase [Lachnospiraceae bacterium]|nr:1-acyl-sn-glycerol-3-phosphate acyltransferase [Lachnospiraceae bacterium]
MKIRTKQKSFQEVMAMPPMKHRKPLRPTILFRTLLRLLSIFELTATHFKYRDIGMEKLGKDEPCLILMNHSSFIDLQIAATIFFSRRFNIVCTSDGFVGKEWLMRCLGCIPTRKFVSDSVLVRDMVYAVRKLKCSILMYPEASYSFDGTATTLPESLGKCVKLLGIPVVMVRTYGAFARQPLYNNLHRRKVRVSADVEYLLSSEDIVSKSADEINELLRERFSFDNFKWQQENQIKIADKNRAEALNRVLYKCPHCMQEGKMVGQGITIICESCGNGYELTEYGYLEPLQEEVKFTHIPDWYQWERECVRKELEEGTYYLDVPVEICIMADTRSIYKVGKGRLTHSVEGFTLTGCDGQLHYEQKPSASYSLYSDYYWYELGDIICIGDNNRLYYCFPEGESDVVAKTRLAAEELYKMKKS